MNKHQEALKKIINDFKWLKKYSGYPEKCATLEPLIRKETPKRLEYLGKNEHGLDFVKCVCGNTVDAYCKYCSDCGQLIDWSEEE